MMVVIKLILMVIKAMVWNDGNDTSNNDQVIRIRIRIIRSRLR